MSETLRTGADDDATGGNNTNEYPYSPISRGNDEEGGGPASPYDGFHRWQSRVVGMTPNATSGRVEEGVRVTSGPNLSTETPHIDTTANTASPYSEPSAEKMTEVKIPQTEDDGMMPIGGNNDGELSGFSTDTHTRGETANDKGVERQESIKGEFVEEKLEAKAMSEEEREFLMREAMEQMTELEKSMSAKIDAARKLLQEAAVDEERLKECRLQLAKLVNKVPNNDNLSKSDFV